MSNERNVTEERFAFLISYKGKALQPVLDTIVALGTDSHCTIDELVDFGISLGTKKYPWIKGEGVMEALVTAIVNKANGKYEILSKVTSKVFWSLFARKQS